jgi:nucleotide-binding universal stress UspA family protein
MPGTLEEHGEDGAHVTTSSPPDGGVFSRLLVVLDHSAVAGAAAGLAHEWTRAFGAEVRYVRVEERSRRPARDHRGPDDRSLEAMRVLVDDRTLRSRNRSFVEGITRAALAFGADVVVLGCDHRRLASRHLCASVRDQLVRATDLPIVVAPTAPTRRSTEDRRRPTAETIRPRGYAHV